MIIVMSCSGSKTIKSSEQELIFCANPDLAPKDEKRYVHPDGKIYPDYQQTWRDWVNSQQKNIKLKEAHSLYEDQIYEKLFSRHRDKLYIFSAGWGIVKATFRLPYYDITFSKGPKIEKYKKRNSKCPTFNDYNQLIDIDKNEDVLFIGGSDYILPFCELTENLKNTKRIIYKSKLKPSILEFSKRSEFVFIEYEGIKEGYTNWHYTFAKRELI